MHNTNQLTQQSESLKNMSSELIMSNFNSPTLARLIDEVKNHNQSTLYAYDRVHNRHNR